MSKPASDVFATAQQSVSLTRADALTTMAETALRNDPEPQPSAERYQVVVHVTAETLAADEDGRCELDSGPRLAPDTARRIACDGLHNPIFAAHGKPIGTVDWIIPEAVLNLDLAISGLMRIEERGREWPRVSEQ